jgi:hypothetical protein
MRFDLGVDGPRRSEANLIRPSREGALGHSTGIHITRGCPVGMKEPRRSGARTLEQDQDEEGPVTSKSRLF